MPAVRDLVDLGNSPWRDHSATSMSQVRQASSNTASPSLVWARSTSPVETSCAAESRAPLCAAA